MNLPNTIIVLLTLSAIAIADEPVLQGSTFKKQTSLTCNSINRTHPRYPKEAKDLHQEGDVHLKFKIDRAGKAHDIVVQTSSGFESLDASSIEALKASTFKTDSLESNCQTNYKFRKIDRTTLD